VLHVQKDTDRKLRSFEAEHSERIEAAEVRAEEQDSPAALEGAIELLEPVRANVKATEALGKEKDAI
jgi:hypothetical protein